VLTVAGKEYAETDEHGAQAIGSQMHAGQSVAQAGQPATGPAQQVGESRATETVPTEASEKLSADSAQRDDVSERPATHHLGGDARQAAGSRPAE